MRLLLDTHAFMWLDNDAAKLPNTLIDLFKKAETSKVLSTVVPWEMRIKASLGKLELRDDLKTIIDEQVQRNRFSVLPVTLEHVYELQALPHHHRDPFDRLLIAQARIEGCTLVTSDPKVGLYDVPVLWDKS